MHGFDGALPAVGGTVTQPKTTDAAGRSHDVRKTIDEDGAGGGAFKGKTIVEANIPFAHGSVHEYSKADPVAKPARSNERPSSVWDVPSKSKNR